MTPHLHIAAHYAGVPVDVVVRDAIDAHDAYTLTGAPVIAKPDRATDPRWWLDERTMDTPGFTYTAYTCTDHDCHPDMEHDQ